MSNLGRAIYLAAFTLMFIVAASTAIYLYSSLNSYLITSNSIISVNKRAESISYDDTLDTDRVITRSEIYITLFNMEQMHVKELHVMDEYKVTPDDVSDYLKDSGTINDVSSLIRFLNANPGRKYTYSSNDNVVSYK